jgi:hypothetical protein
MKRTVYSPELNGIFTVIEEKGNALVCEEGCTLSKKMTKAWEELPYGQQVYLSSMLAYRATGNQKVVEVHNELLDESIKYINDLTPASHDKTWITPEEKEKAKQLYHDVEKYVWGFDEDLFRSDINKTVNQDFYD